MTNRPTPATMSVEAAGRLLGISRSAAYRAANAGTLPALRVGRRLLVPTAKLHQLLGLPADPAPDNGDGSEPDGGRR